MNVNLDEMRIGADWSYSAADLAEDAFDQLSRGRFMGGIFGEFDTAEAFHAVAAAIHSNHLQRLRDHQNGLGALGDRAHRTATAFAEMEDRNAAALRSVPWPTTPA